MKDGFKAITNGTVFRVQKESHYTCIDNQCFNVVNMSLRAKGLLCTILSLPPSWDYTLKGLCSLCKESYNTVRNTVKELEDLGYLEIKKLYPNQTTDGRIHYEYTFYEKSIKPDALKMRWD